MIKKGDKVEVGGAVATVEAVWAQGRHTTYKLDDGREVLDLEALIAQGKAKLVVTPAPQPRLRFDPKKLVAEDNKD